MEGSSAAALVVVRRGKDEKLTKAEVLTGQHSGKYGRGVFPFKI